MLFSEVHHSPSAGMREHLYSVCALSVPIAAGQKKKKNTEKQKGGRWLLTEPQQMLSKLWLHQSIPQI